MRKFLTAVGAALLLTSLAGCFGDGPVKTPLPTPSATPVFASDEEALAAAEAAYAGYIELSDEISADGGSGPERLGSVVTGEELERSIVEFDTFRENGKRTAGTTKFDSMSLQRFDSEDVVVYVCVDVSDVRILNSLDEDVTPPGRPSRVPLEVAFQIESSERLLLSSSDVWGDNAPCEN